MKIVIFIAIWACLAFSQTADAQQSEPQRNDTLIIQIEGNSQLHIIGNSLKEIAKYERADSLKNLFVVDYNKALNNNSISLSTHRIHYLIGKDGQRRMKAAGDAYTEEPFDLEAEKKRFQYNLPKIHYTIYDLVKDVEMHFYLQDSSGINKLENLHISDAIKMLSENKKDVKNNYSLGLQRDGLGFKINQRAGKRQFELQGKPSLGAILISDHLSPMTGVEIGFVFSNKYKIPKTKFGFLWHLSMINTTDEVMLINYTEVTNYEFSISFNAVQSQKEKWAGFHGGIITGLDNFGFPKKAEKFGFHFPLNDDITYSFDYISNKKTTWSNMFKIDPNEKVIYSMSVRAWF